MQNCLEMGATLMQMLRCRALEYHMLLISHKAFLIHAANI